MSIPFKRVAVSSSMQAREFLQTCSIPLLGSLACLALVGLAASQALGSARGVKISIVDHGAVGDGSTLNTNAIQRAIDTCSRQGGGTVTVPAGRFVTGTILLKDNVTLQVDEGAVLLGSTNPADYRNVDPFKDGLGAEVGFALLAAVDVRNVGIAGRGEINGRGKEIGR
jgi:polygalacturonase